MKDMENQTENASNNTLGNELLEKLRSALKTDGDFPASAHVVSELKILTSNPQTTANQITEIILREPSLGVRVLHLVNSSFYRRAKPIMTVSQAVIQIGMRPLAELCSGLILLQKFVPEARKGGPFASCLQKTIVTSLLSSQIGSSINTASNSQEEQGYLVGSFSEMGALLLAYYFPKVYDSASRRAEMKNLAIDQSIYEITGLTPLQLSIEVLKALGLPEYYQNVIHAAMQLDGNNTVVPELERQSDAAIKSSRVVCAAREISRAIVEVADPIELANTLESVSAKYSIAKSNILHGIQALPTLFQDHCDAIELKLPSLPAAIINFEPNTTTSVEPATYEPQAKLARLVQDIQKAVDAKEPTVSVITLVMEALALGMEFSRVLLLLIDKNHTQFSGRIAIGDKIDFDPRQIIRPIATIGHYAPDQQAFKYSRPVFVGDPILTGGHPLTALPIGKGDKTVGVIYADRVESVSELIDANEQSVIHTLTELLNRSVLSHSKN